MSKFVYVFDRETRDQLLREGFSLLKDDQQNSIFVFNNSETLHFAFNNITCVFSDVLTF